MPVSHSDITWTPTGAGHDQRVLFGAETPPTRVIATVDAGATSYRIGGAETPGPGVYYWRVTDFDGTTERGTSEIGSIELPGVSVNLHSFQSDYNAEEGDIISVAPTVTLFADHASYVALERSGDYAGDEQAATWAEASRSTSSGSPISLIAQTADLAYRVVIYRPDGTDLWSQVATATVSTAMAPINASFEQAVAADTLTVDASASVGEGPLSYSWDFGDGSVGSGATASHTYAASGTYVVTLTITDDAARSQQAQQSVTVTVSTQASGGAVGVVAQSASPSPYGEPVDLSVPNRSGDEPDTVEWYTPEGDLVAFSSDAAADFSVTIPAEYTYQDIALTVRFSYADASQLEASHALNLEASSTSPSLPGTLSVSATYDQGDVPVTTTAPVNPGSVAPAAIPYYNEDVPTQSAAPVNPGSIGATVSYDPGDVPTA